MTLGIDISEHNGILSDEDWQALVDAGVRFVYVRCSYGESGIDEAFATNVENAHRFGLLVGAYHYSYALTVDDARKEALHCRNVIDDAGCLLELPVFFDMEDADGYKQRNGFSFRSYDVTAICRAFISRIGLDCGIYASLSWLNGYIDWQSLGCAVWNAQWGDTDDIKGYVWQFTDNLEIGGKTYDGDYMYVDF